MCTSNTSKSARFVFAMIDDPGEVLACDFCKGYWGHWQTISGHVYTIFVNNVWMERDTDVLIVPLHIHTYIFLSSRRIDWYAAWPAYWVTSWHWPKVKFWPWPFEVKKVLHICFDASQRWKHDYLVAIFSIFLSSIIFLEKNNICHKFRYFKFLTRGDF